MATKQAFLHPSLFRIPSLFIAYASGDATKKMDLLNHSRLPPESREAWRKSSKLCWEKKRTHYSHLYVPPCSLPTPPGPPHLGLDNNNGIRIRSNPLLALPATTTAKRCLPTPRKDSPTALGYIGIGAMTVQKEGHTGQDLACYVSTDIHRKRQRWQRRRGGVGNSRGKLRYTQLFNLLDCVSTDRPN